MTLLRDHFITLLLIKPNNKVDGLDNKISFNAKPQAIISKLQDIPLCPCKKRFVGSVASFFNDIESQMRKNADMPDRFVYSLDRQTEIPEKCAI